MRDNRYFTIKKALLLGCLGLMCTVAFAGLKVSAKELNDEYVYCVGSVSKVYSTAAVMQLVDEGKVSLDAPVTDYIPNFKMADSRYKDITVRMLMNHTSGIQGTTYVGPFLYGKENAFHDEVVFDTLAKQRLRCNPGEYSAYCNDGFDLLGVIVENVTGMSFGDYVARYLAAPTGGTSTSTGDKASLIENLAPAFLADGVRFENDVIMSIGAGGVYATASDTANFGAAFFRNADELLSEKAKSDMETLWQNTDDFKDRNGLGWDSVNDREYENTEVKVLGKGGDVDRNHAYLLVAPEEEISVAVLTNGGNSKLNQLVAEAILDACLEEEGLKLKEEETSDFDISLDIPSSYDKYEGDYVINSGLGWDSVRISFPDHEYVHVENIGPLRSGGTDYGYTKDGSFVKLAYEVADSGINDIKPASNPEVLRFEEGTDGKVYIKIERKENLPEVGVSKRSTYCGEKMEPNPISEELMAFWSEVCASEYMLSKDAYNSQTFDFPIVRMVVSEDVPGYLYCVTGMGTRILKIVDEENAVAFTTIPSSSNRDLLDIKAEASEDGITLCCSNGWELISDDDIPAFDESVKEVDLKANEAVWFNIGEARVNTDVIMTSRPEDSAVYVYNKYGEPVYSSHIIGVKNSLPMPKDGKVMFIGGSEGKVILN